MGCVREAERGFPAPRQRPLRCREAQADRPLARLYSPASGAARTDAAHRHQRPPALPRPVPDAPRLLVAEDDADLADLLALHLADAGYDAEIVGDGALALQKGLATAYDAILLDWMMPGMTGADVCRELREAGRTAPILMLTARDAEADRVAGLDLGADDYVTKPFSIREVLARVAALLRRVAMAAPATPEPPLATGALAIAPAERRVLREGTLVDLTAKEYDLLVLLARHPGQVFSRQELLDRVWGVRFSGYAHTVNTHINRLRAKIEPDPSAPVYVRTVWGVGYRFADPSEVA